MPGIARTRFRLARFNVIALLFVLALPCRGETQGADVLRIYIARHGQTDWNVEGRLQGDTNVPLNATGRRQAVELAEQLKGVQLDAIFSSALKRRAHGGRCRRLRSADIAARTERTTAGEISRAETGAQHDGRSVGRRVPIRLSPDA